MPTVGQHATAMPNMNHNAGIHATYYDETPGRKNCPIHATTRSLAQIPTTIPMQFCQRSNGQQNRGFTGIFPAH